MDMDNKRPVFAIDKNYKFFAVGGGYETDYDIHVQLNHDQVMKLGQEFLDDDHNAMDSDWGESSGFKDQMDKIAADALAQSFHQQYLEDLDDEESEEDRSLEDFYDEAYDYLGCYYYGYNWSKEFKQDCISYYQQHRDL